MSFASVRTPASLRAAFSLPLWRKVGRGVALGFGGLLVAVGTVGAVLPGHLGVPVLVVGLILVLRSSIQARRRFIGLQRQHPKLVFPIRRLLRREPEVAPVAWQQLLRFEKMLFPRSWRQARRVRRRLRRKKA